MTARTHKGQFCARESMGGRSSSRRERRVPMGAHPRRAASLPVASLPRSTIYRGATSWPGSSSSPGASCWLGWCSAAHLSQAGLRAGAVIGWAFGGFQGTPHGPGAGKEGAPVAQALSPEAALAEVQSYTSMDLNVDQITGLRDILAIKRNDTAIHRHLKKHGHPLGELPSGVRWWEKVQDNLI
jgi:hypothetical protein